MPTTSLDEPRCTLSSAPREPGMLSVQRVNAGYGVSQVLFDVSIDVNAGEVVTLLGRNGMGKTTTILSIMGILPLRSGEIVFDGKRVDGWPSFRVARLGLGLVPEGRQVFPNLTVKENIAVMASHAGRSEQRWTYDAVLELFPPLAARVRSMAGLLSGGEQQMLAIARALVTNPRLLILDEATEGLSPMNRAVIWKVLALLKAAGQSILIVDKHIQSLSQLADYHYVLEKGRIAWRGTSQSLRSDPELLNRHLSV
jgi:branched-chain amino acid transport system ATP-binding protein